MAESDIISVLTTLWSELLDGPSREASWVLNPGDGGLFAALGRLTAAQASAVAAAGDSSVAAHVDHLRYGLELLNRWSRGEQPFADADYRASWHRVTVSEAEWADRREALRRETGAWSEAMRQPRELSTFDLTGVAASVVHLAYHLGAIRQLASAARGPSADAVHTAG